MKSDRLFSRDFTLMVIGQIISLLGNAVLRFALNTGDLNILPQRGKKLGL